MAYDKELEIRLQFLDETAEYLDTLDDAVMDLSQQRVDIQKINAAMRAAHSVKGGASMMGFPWLSHLAHRLEDSFKVLKIQKQSLEIDRPLENLLLTAVACLRILAQEYRQALSQQIDSDQAIDPAWIEAEVEPTLQALHQRLGDPQAEDASSVLAPEEGQDVLRLLFETEVEGCLQRLEAVFQHPEKPCLREEVLILAQELGGLGEMLELEVFCQLCGVVIDALEQAQANVPAIAQRSLEAWRQAQTAVLSGHLDQLPDILAALQQTWAPSPNPAQPGPSESDNGATPPSSLDLTWSEVAPDIAEIEEVLATTNTWDDLEPAPLTDSSDIWEPAISTVPWEELAPPEATELPSWDELAADSADLPSWDELAAQDEAIHGTSSPEQSATTEIGQLDSDCICPPEDSSPSPEAIPPTLLASDDEALFRELEELIQVLPDPVPGVVADQLPQTSSPQVPEALPSWESPIAADEALPTPAVAAREINPKDARTRNFKILEMKTDGKTSLPAIDQTTTVRISVRQLNQLNDLFGELTIERNGLDLYLKRLRDLTRSLQFRVKALEQSNSQMRMTYDRIAPQAIPAIPVFASAAASFSPPLAEFRSHFDILEMDQYSDIHLLSQQVMETVVQIQEVTSDLDINLEDAIQTARDLGKTSKQLQTGLTQIRMRPMSDIVDRFPRALRELCLQYGKQAKLQISGGNTLVDRSILEALSDPLMHLLRNAFDHGIEPPEVRRAKGKPETGTIQIRANHRGNRTLISISDDGGGIPLEKIRQRANQMGLDSSLMETASDEEILALIFEPGFSTSDQVTALSGRGVGMDVVRDSIRQIRGDITVSTQPGVGTTFTLSVPFTLSVVQALLVESNGMLLAIPTDVVEEMLLLESQTILVSAGSEVLNWDDTMVQLFRLGNWLQFNCPRIPHLVETAATIDAPTVLMINQGSQLVGLQVDRCWSEQELAVRRVEGNLPLPKGFAGCAIIGDGRVVPLVNVTELLDWMSGNSLNSNNPTPATSTETPAPLTNLLPSQKATILIVDDSINVRRFLALTLERAGFQVEQAKDGQDALEKLQRGLTVQAVICDIEMPRLDGYGFLARVKSDPSLQQLPIAMLTSRSGAKHRQLAVSLGAAGYFSKPYNEQELLHTLDHLIHSASPVACL